MSDPVKGFQITADCENPRVIVHRNWGGPLYMRTMQVDNVVKVEAPDKITVPMFGRMGRLLQARQADLLRRMTPKAVDVILIHCTTPSGCRTNGMIAIPKNWELKVEVVTA